MMEVTRTVYCANIVDLSFLLHILILISQFWIFNMNFITADQLLWEQPKRVGYDVLCVRLALVDAPACKDIPRSECSLQAMSIDNFMPCLSGGVSHDTWLFWD